MDWIGCKLWTFRLNRIGLDWVSKNGLMSNSGLEPMFHWQCVIKNTSIVKSRAHVIHLICAKMTLCLHGQPHHCDNPDDCQSVRFYVGWHSLSATGLCLLENAEDVGGRRGGFTLKYRRLKAFRGSEISSRAGRGKPRSWEGNSQSYQLNNIHLRF